MYQEKILHYYLKKKYFVDIDDLESFELVEFRIKKINCIKFVKKNENINVGLGSI